MNDDKQPEQACSDPIRKRRILWCSQPNWEKLETIDYYADRLNLCQVDDGLFCLELTVSGTTTVLPLKNKDKYLI